MAITTPKTTPTPASARRPTLRQLAVPVPTQAPTSPQIDQQEAAHAIGYASGLTEGMKMGEERARTRETTESKEDLRLRVERIIAFEMWPRAIKAVDQILAMIILSIGAGCVVAVAAFVWRWVIRWA